jgi:YbgC/YbaW family acyl-CoA thioester hydrolase
MSETPSPMATPSAARRTSRSAVRVRYAETDKMGIVYYAHYLVWFEIGRTEWLRDTGWTYLAMEGEGFGLPVIEAQCEYKSSARYDDELQIETAARLVTGYTVHATVDRSGRPVRLPARVKELLT